MVRSALLLAALLIPGTAVAQTVIVQGAPPTGIPQRDTPPATGTSVIRGRVVDAASGTPLRKGIVRIFGAEIRESRSATTDSEGRYEFTDLPAGQFNVNVTKAGYVDVSYGQTAPSEMGKQMKVGEKQVVEKIDFSLPRGAVITGRVLDEYGEPIADVQVSPLRNQYMACGPRPTNVGRFATTNDIGEFRLFGLPPGQYFISAGFSCAELQWTIGRWFGICAHLLSRHRKSGRRAKADHRPWRQRIRCHVDARANTDSSRQRNSVRQPGTTAGSRDR